MINYCPDKRWSARNGVRVSHEQMTAIMTNKITLDDINRQHRELWKDPERFLELTNRLVEQHPDLDPDR